MNKALKIVHFLVEDSIIGRLLQQVQQGGSPTIMKYFWRMEIFYTKQNIIMIYTGCK